MQKIKGVILSALGVFSFAGFAASLHTTAVTGAGHYLAMPGGGDWEPEPEIGTHGVGVTTQVTSTDVYLAMPGGGDWEPEPEDGAHAVSPVATT